MLAAPRAAGAQQAGKVPRVGVPVAVSAAFAAPYIDGRQAQRDVGYTEGQNIIIPPGMAVAPIVYAYAKQELVDRGLV